VQEEGGRRRRRRRRSVLGVVVPYQLFSVQVPPHTSPPGTYHYHSPFTDGSSPTAWLRLLTGCSPRLLVVHRLPPRIFVHLPGFSSTSLTSCGYLRAVTLPPLLHVLLLPRVTWIPQLFVYTPRYCCGYYKHHTHHPRHHAFPVAFVAHLRRGCHGLPQFGFEPYRLVCPHTHVCSGLIHCVRHIYAPRTFCV